LAFADGSSARISAIQAALRYYRPHYFHFWQIKTFWNECKICLDDIEHHTFEVIAAEPAIRVDEADKCASGCGRNEKVYSRFQKYF